LSSLLTPNLAFGEPRNSQDKKPHLHQLAIDVVILPLVRHVSAMSSPAASSHSRPLKSPLHPQLHGLIWWFLSCEPQKKTHFKNAEPLSQPWQ
jgi:hypothetical protein